MFSESKICSWHFCFPYILKQKLNHSNLSMCSCPHQRCEAFFILEVNNVFCWNNGGKEITARSPRASITIPSIKSALPTLFNPACKKHHFTLGCQLMYGQSWEEGKNYLCGCRVRITLKILNLQCTNKGVEETSFPRCLLVSVVDCLIGEKCLVVDGV